MRQPKLRAVGITRDAQGSFGFELDGHFVSDIDIHGPANRKNILQIGDQLVEVSELPPFFLSICSFSLSIFFFPTSTFALLFGSLCSFCFIFQVENVGLCGSLG